MQSPVWGATHQITAALACYGWGDASKRSHPAGHHPHFALAGVPHHFPLLHVPCCAVQVRDLSFSPDSGAIRRITYDEFGLPFLPISFFDCYSVAMPDVISIGRGELLVYDDAKYRERKESAGLFAAIPSLFKSLNGPSRGGSAQLALPAPGGTSDMYRLGGAGSTSGSSSSSRFLPTDYTYEQWQADLRRWEAETGMTYEQYLRYELCSV